MATCEPPFYWPLIWPVGNFAKTVILPEDGESQKNKAEPFLDLYGHAISMLAALRNTCLALLCLYCTANEYPAFGSGSIVSWDWMWPIFVRNIIATWLICGFWDWFLYFSPFQRKLHKYKMNQVYPSLSQFKHDAFYTTLASCWASCIEIGLCYGWATGALPMQRNLGDTPIRNIILALMVTHLRTPHFYFMHRFMHPWKTTRIPDFGKLLYRHVHSLHHKSYNPTAFSGTSMHPVEATLYYTAALVPVALGVHPVFAVATIIDCGLAAWLGHDGFQWPGSGSYYHLLHHKHFDGNYGAEQVPLDWLFGTFISCKEDLRKVWREQPAGEEANETSLHNASSKAEKVE